MATLDRPTEEDLLERLRSGDETAFSRLVDDLHLRLRALASTFTASPALVEDIVQETWLAVIQGLRGFQGRSSLRTWIFSILVRRARTLTAREARRSEVALDDPEAVANGEWVPGSGRHGLWEESPTAWNFQDPAHGVQAREVLEIVQKALVGLPERQRRAVMLRDVEDVDSADVCNILGVRETNLRVLLHRGRARIRRALDRYMRDVQGSLRPALNGSSASSKRPASSATFDPMMRPKETR